MGRIVECVSCDESVPHSELAHEEAGLFICQTCFGKLQPVKGPARNCPNDGAEMERMLAYRFVPLDQCPKCGGVWTDRAEHEMLHRITEAAKNRSVGEAWIRGKLGV